MVENYFITMKFLARLHLDIGHLLNIVMNSSYKRNCFTNFFRHFGLRELGHNVQMCMYYPEIPVSFFCREFRLFCTQTFVVMNRM